MAASREIRLKSRPVGTPTPDDFELATVELTPPAVGEVQVRNLWMSVDPATRIRMGDMSEMDIPIPAFEIGHALDSAAVGEVVESNDASFEVGDLVHSWLGWREAFNAPAAALEKLETGGLPPQTFLGVAGVTGLTAWAGLLQVAVPKAKEVIFVSGAAGAVGSLVCQIAKLKGLTVIGSAGGPHKVAYLKEIGVDRAIDYKAEADIAAALKAVAPEGIDIYFDNVGGDHLEAAIGAGRRGARIVLCGSMVGLNATEPAPGPRNMMLFGARQMRMESVTVFTYLNRMGEFQHDLRQWVNDGKVTWRETVFDGIEHAPDALLGLFRGDNIGKMLVKLA